MKKYFLPVFAFAIIFGFTSYSQDLTSVDFTLKDIDGNEQSFQGLLKSFRDKDGNDKGVTVISFWAMWCVPCKQELKALIPVYDKLKEKHLRYIAINTDNPRSTAKVKSYVTAQEFPYIFLLDPNSEVFNKLNGQSMPYSLIVHNNGSLVEKRVGFLAGDEKEIEKILVKALE